MCLSKVYIQSNGDKQLLMEDITSVEIRGDTIILKTLFGEEKEIEANIKEIDFLTHNIVLGGLVNSGG